MSSVIIFFSYMDVGYVLAKITLGNLACSIHLPSPFEDSQCTLMLNNLKSLMVEKLINFSKLTNSESSVILECLSLSHEIFVSLKSLGNLDLDYIKL